MVQRYCEEAAGTAPPYPTDMVVAGTVCMFPLQVEQVMRACAQEEPGKPSFPMVREYDFKNDKNNPDNPDLPIALRADMLRE